MIANLKKAARDRDIVLIAGGEFGRQELSEAAHMLECYPALLDALRTLVDYFGPHPDVDNGLDEALTAARAAIARFTLLEA